MASQERSRDRVRILSLDSGGPGTYSQALILERIEESFKKLDGNRNNMSNLIRDHFDLIGGVGFGGLLAIMLGRLGMTATQAKDAILKVAEAVFPLDTTEQLTQEKRSQHLREVLEGIAIERRMPVDAKLHDKHAEEPGCIVVVFAATSDDDQQAHALRTYETTGSPLNLTIVEAACATISIHPFFAPVVVGTPMLRQSFVGGPKDCMNPALKLLDQSKALFGPEREVSALVSIGCGHPSFKYRPGPSDSSQRNQRESTSSGTFLDILSPGQMIRESLNKRKAKKARSSKANSNSVDIDPNAGWNAIDLMSRECEETAKEVLGRFAVSLSYMRLNVEKEMAFLNFNDWSGLGSITGNAKTYLDQSKLESTIGRLLETPKKVERPSKNAPKAPPRVSPNFVPRNIPYATMRHYLVDDRVTSQKILVITGMGGCGKTQIVSYFLQENESLYSHLIYVDASSVESINNDLEAWIQSIKEHEGDDWQGALSYIRHSLRGQQWVLVLDNADEIQVDLVPFIPACNHGTILITSRNRHRGDLANTAHIELGVMTAAEAMGVLLLWTKRRDPLASEEDTAAQNLLAELGCLPLAVSLAGSYCRQLSSSPASPYTFGQYLETFRSERSHLLDRQQVNSLDQYKQSVSTTIALSYGRISDSEKGYFDLFIMFDGADISLEMFSVAAKRGFRDCAYLMERPEGHAETVERLHSLFLAERKWKTVEVETAIGNLAANSLLSTTSIAGTIHIHVHPLVQSWARNRQDQARSSQYTLMAAQVLTSCNGSKNTRLNRVILPHIQLLRTTGKIAGLHINCRMAFALTLRERGYYKLAAEYCSAAYEEVKDALGLEKRVTLEAAAELADIRYWQGQYEEAEKLQSVIWERRKEKFGMDHPEAIESATALARTYGRLGRHQDALRIQQESWKIWKDMWGVEHPDPLGLANDLAVTYGQLGRYKDALELQQGLWEKEKKSLAEDHPHTLVSANDLALTYNHLGRHQDALQLHIEVWEKWKKILGIDHPYTLTSASNLAQTYSHLGRHQDALQVQVEVWKKRNNILGADHTDTLMSGDKLSLIYRDLGRHQEALQLQLETWEKQKQILGVDHDQTLVSANNLALVYGNLGRHQDALRLQIETWERRKQRSGVDYPETLVSANNLARTYSHLGRHQDALQLQLDVWEKQKEKLGSDHPRTLVSANDLALTYGHLGRHPDAMQLQVEVWRKQKEVSGVGHPHTLLSGDNLVRTYGRLGRHQDALVIQLEVWQKRKEDLGLEHSKTLWSGFTLGCIYFKLDKREQAFQLFREVLTLQMLLGRQHPDTQSMMTEASSYGFRMEDETV